jgi:hypothetical protein
MTIDPWDPRVKSVSWFKDEYNYLQQSTVQFIVYLHCQAKIGWAFSYGHEHGIDEQFVIDRLIDEVQPKIDEAYNELKKLKGGSVDIHGQPIWSIAPINIFGNEPETPTMKVAQLDEYQEWQYWCGEAGQQFKPVSSKKMLKEKFQATKKYFAEKDAALYQAQVDVGTTVQQNLHKLFPALKEMVTCPVCAKLDKDRSSALDRMIIHLNDEHRWTREQVADWLESLDIDLGMKENV